MSRHRAHGPFAIFALFALLVALNLALAVLHYLAELWPLLLFGAICAALWRVHGRRIAPARTPRIIVGQVAAEDTAIDRAELGRLRDDNAKLRAKVRVLSDMINGPEVRP